MSSPIHNWDRLCHPPHDPVVVAEKEITMDDGGIDYKHHISSCAELKSRHRYISQLDQMNILCFGENPSSFFQPLNLATGYR